MIKFTRTLLTLGVTLAAYWAYALLAVPWIEPGVERNEGEESGGQAMSFGSERRDMSQFFAANAWQSGANSKILETSQGALVFKDYEFTDDDRIVLKPVSLVFRGGRPDDDADTALQRTIILDAPEGVELHTDGQMNLAQFKMGEIAGARLLGQITIRSPERVPHRQSLHLVTRNVQIDKEKIWTPNDVAFRYGENHGSGKDLVILVNQEEDRHQEEDQGLAAGTPLGGLKSLELVQVHGVEIKIRQGGVPPFASQDTDAKKTDARDAGNSPSRQQQPSIVRVTCRGSFRFDFVSQVATFQDDVQVVRMDTSKGVDQLHCQVLELAFARKKLPQGSSESGQAVESFGGVELRQLSARGTPVTLRAPSSEAGAVCESLSYDLLTRRVVLQSRSEVSLKYKLYDVVAKNLEYELHEQPERLGRLWAQGPGSISGTMGKDRKSPFTASWSRLLQLEPQQQNHVFSLYDAARVQVGEGEETSGFRADRIHFYVTESPKFDSAAPSADQEQTNALRRKYQIIPDRLWAQSNVVFDSPRLSGASREVNAWFKRIPGQIVEPSKSAGGPTLLSAAGRGEGPAKPDQQRKFDLVGDAIHMQILVDDAAKMQIDDVTIEGAVEVNQVHLDRRDRAPLKMAGEKLQISNVSRQDNRVQILGEPARISAGGISVQGRRLYFDQPSNRVWIDGAGEMTFPSSRRETGALRATTKVAWSGSMNFDGRTAIFDKDIEAEGVRPTSKDDLNRYFAMSGRMEVTLDRAVDFQNSASPDEQPQIGLLVFDGGVFFQNRTQSATSGAMKSIDKMQTPNLSIDQVSGEIRSVGAGWMSTVRHSKDRFLKPAGAPQERAVAKSEPRLIYLHVQFEQGIVGNLRDKQVRFLRDVNAVYGPVDDWGDEIDPDRRGGVDKKSALLRCDELIVTDMGAQEQTLVELIALGNTIVENSAFQARAHRVSYTEAKDLLILEGDGRNNARLLMYGKTPGANKELVARRINFWPGTRDFKVDKAQSINFGSIGNQTSAAVRPAEASPARASGPSPPRRQIR